MNISSQKIKGRLKFLSLFLMVLSSQCTQKETAAREEATAATATETTPTETTKNTNIIQALAKEKNKPETVKYKGEEARIRLTKDVYFDKAQIAENIEVPSVQLKKDKADFFKVLRCSASYSFKTLTGEPFALTTPLDQREWAWTQALSSSNQCKIIHEHHPGETFNDLGAKTGSYYYVFNPCINETTSVNNKDECSNMLVFSKVFEYKSLIQENIQAMSVRLSAAEATLAASEQKLVNLARLIELNLRSCEELIAKEQQRLKFRQAMLQISVLVVGGLVGASLGIFTTALGGPMSIILVGTMAMFMLTPIISKKLGWPEDTDYRCSNPALADEFKVTERMAQFETLIQQDIPRQVKNLQEVLVEMNKLDTKILTYDQAIVKAKSLKIDTNNPMNFLGLPGGLSGLLGK